jgi:hypothetical protein
MTRNVAEDMPQESDKSRTTPLQILILVNVLGSYGISSRKESRRQGKLGTLFASHGQAF